MNNLQVIRRFIEAVEADDKERILAFFTENSVFHNVPIEPVRGPDAIWQMMDLVHGPATEIKWVIHRLEEAPSGTVYSERTDRFKIKGQWAEFKCLGIHEVDAEGKIELWRDYFDMTTSMATMPIELPALSSPTYD